MDFIWFLIVGAIAGWLGSMLFKGSGSGLLLNIVLGIVGAQVGGWLLNVLGLQFSVGSGDSGFLITRILVAAIGAFVVM